MARKLWYTTFLFLTVFCFGQQPKIALVLSGGGARGSAHVGVLKALEELRVPIHIVTGTSMGAIIGGSYATGLSAGEIEAFLGNVPWREVFIDLPPRKYIDYRRKLDDQTFLTRFEMGFNQGSFQLPPGIINGQKLLIELQEVVIHANGIQDFDHLSIPFRAVATDIETGNPVVLRHGDLAHAIRASMSIPGVFSPVEIDGKSLVDGGIVMNLPVSLALEMGADIVIAVDVGEELFQKEELRSIPKITNQLMGIQIKKNVESELAKADIVIQPKLNGFSSAEFEKSLQMVPAGYEAAMTKKMDLQALAVSEVEYKQYQLRKNSDVKLKTFSGVEVRGGRISDHSRILKRMEIKPGDAFDFSAIREGLQKLYQTGDYERIDFVLESSEALQTDLIIIPKEKSWGPNTLRFGLTLFADLEGESAFEFLSSYNIRNLNRLRGEVKLTSQLGENPRFLAEWAQPLELSETFLVSAYAQSESASTYREMEPGRFAPFRVDTGFVGFDFVFQLRHMAQIRVGGFALRQDWREDQSVENRMEFESEYSALRIRANLDQFDNMNFPRSGTFFFIDYTHSMPEDDLVDDWKHVVGFLGWAANHGKHSVLSLTNFYHALDDDSPEIYEMGGLFRMSGYPRNEIKGRFGGSTAMLYLYRFAQLPPVIGEGMYVGGSIEAGNLWLKEADMSFDDLLYSASITFGLDTALGPVYLARGFSEGNDGEWYLFIGRTF